MKVKTFEVQDYYNNLNFSQRIVVPAKEANYRGSLRFDLQKDLLYKPVTKLNVCLRDEKGRFVSYKSLTKGLLILKAEIDSLPNCNWK
ncbi:hypothetical protein APT65_00085 [Trabzonvirus APT65]|uniref:Uncharacterized protein n=1 Tax=Aeromonas phage APT65 TaxID=2982914 RepID=A0A9E8GAK8_9CAUD|nr:hypothetical protein APT65_00085 [Aeromonas phage APT65]